MASRFQLRRWRVWMNDSLVLVEATDERVGRGTMQGYSISDVSRVEVPVYGYINNKEQYLKRLRRVEGQVRGLQRMVEEERYCIDILTQVTAATKALHAVALGVLEGHIATCVVDAAGGPDAAAKVKEATDAIGRLLQA